jgi:hypothetical protein
MEVSDQLHTPAALSPGKWPQYLLERTMAVPQKDQPGHGGKEKISHHCPYQELNPSRHAHYLITTVTELPYSNFI